MTRMTSKPVIVFHCPFTVSRNTLHSANLVRPLRMLEAFKRVGFRVVEITGTAKRRNIRITRLKRRVREGLSVDFVYSESSNLPLFFNEKHRLPSYPFLEYRFFRWLRRKSIPTGLFLRDLHWRFPHFRRYPLYKRLPAVLFYWLDWLMYISKCDHLFLPSIRLKSHLPTNPRKAKISALPPGCSPDQQNQRGERETVRKFSEGLRLFYVGGITPPLYDLSPLFQCARQLPGEIVVLCCRQEEWGKNRSYYTQYNVDNVHVVHSQGPGLAEYYHQADLFALAWTPYCYLELIIPYKVFEALEYHLPIVTLAGTEAARLIEAEGFGWVVNDVAEMVALINYLRERPDVIRDKRKQLQVLAKKHSWVKRAETVAEALAAARRASPSR